MKEDLTSAYRAMAADTEREREALEWSDGLMFGETHAVEERSQTCRQTEIHKFNVAFPINTASLLRDR